MRFDPTDCWYELIDECGGIKEYRVRLRYVDDDTPIEVLYFCTDYPTAWIFTRRIDGFSERSVRISKVHDADTIEAIARENDCLPPYEFT